MKVMTALMFRALEAVWQIGPGAVSVSHSPPRYSLHPCKALLSGRLFIVRVSDQL